MCGILLIKSKKTLNKNKCLRALSLLRSRGPDKGYYNFYENKKLFIGNRLLSITGKYKKDHTLYKSHNHSISFNGEIYNYKNIQKKNKIKFIEENDTKFLITLIDKLGIKKALKKIDGMFAFISFDKIKRTINIATDAQGEKRLYIFENEEYLIVSTTIKPILYFIQKISIDLNVLKSYFFTRHLLFYKNTIYKDIKLIEPGSLINIDLKKEKKIKKFHTNPLNFISKKKYLFFKNMNYKKLVNYFDDLFKNQVKQMIPDRKFGCIVTGGVDSGLVFSYINDLVKPNYCAGIDHYKKDNAIKNLNLFENKFNQRIFKIKLNSKKYFNFFSQVYSYLLTPFLTHDYPSRYVISKFFQKKKCKVMFTGDGADELFGGYEAYTNINWKTSSNSSPYSKFELGDNFKSDKNFKAHNQLWKKAFKKYSFFMSKKEASIQASLFTDYYIQGISVSNTGTDLLSGMNSIEPRCIFIRKSVIQSVINLPIKYKINLKEKNEKFKTKPLLKSLFIKRYNKSMIVKKQGFSGFPDESINYLNSYQQKNFRRFSEYFNKLNSYNLLWKTLNLFFFNLFCDKYIKNKLKIDFKNIFN